MSENKYVKNSFDNAVMAPFAISIFTFIMNPIDYWFIIVLILMLEILIAFSPALHLDPKTQQSIYIGPFNLLYFLSSLPLIVMILGFILHVFFKSEHFTQVFLHSLFLICSLLVIYLNPFKLSSNVWGNTLGILWYFLFFFSVAFLWFEMPFQKVFLVTTMLAIASIFNIVLAPLRIIPNKNVLQRYRGLRLTFLIFSICYVIFLKYIF